MKRLLVISDLDGTLLDQRYSFAAATAALQLLERHAIPLILCSSKTRAEIEHYRTLLCNRHPFISENGGGIFIPSDYFPPQVFRHTPLAEELGSYLRFRLGAPYTRLRRTLIRLRHKGFAVTGFGDLDAARISALTGLPPDQAELAGIRDFDEPFLFEGTPAELERLQAHVRREQLYLTHGRLWHLLGDSDKGRAVELLLDCYRAQGGEVISIGLGDQHNDFPMLERVDFPVLIRRPEGNHASGCAAANLHYSQEIGPKGWNEVLQRLVPTLLASCGR